MTEYKQTQRAERFDLIPPGVLMAAAKVIGDSAKANGEWAWCHIPADIHAGRAMRHIAAWFDAHKDDNMQTPEDNLIHAICRLMFAWYMSTTEGAGIYVGMIESQELLEQVREMLKNGFIGKVVASQTGTTETDKG